MTLASRLSTAANLGILDDQTKAKEIAKANLALIQIQGVVVGGLAAIFALLVGWIPQLKYLFSSLFLDNHLNSLMNCKSWHIKKTQFSLTS